MSQDYTKPEFKKLLQKLQEESWQLELLISGFAIFGLFIAFEPISIAMKEAENSQQVFKTIISFLALISCSILIFNLLLHVMLRGLWIGALGLRYVSGDIDYDSLKYSPRFTKYLKKKVGSFDKYIATLENYCSIIFAVSFLLIFYVLAITFTILAIALIAIYIISNDDLPNWLSKGFGISLIVFIVFGMFFTLIDFVTLGFLKKKKWISKIYFPVYWVFSFLTLSFLYRPLVYNFLDNKFGKRLSFMLLPFYIAILVLISFKYQNSNYLSTSKSSSEIYANSRNYDDYIIANDEFVKVASIPSKVIQSSFLKVFIVFDEDIEDDIFKFNETLKPEKDKRGLNSDMFVSTSAQIQRNTNDSKTSDYLKTFNDMHTMAIDSIGKDVEFIVTSNTKGELGFETFTNIKYLQEGKHILKIKRLEKIDGGTTATTISTIPFWYYPDI